MVYDIRRYRLCCCTCGAMQAGEFFLLLPFSIRVCVTVDTGSLASREEFPVCMCVYAHTNIIACDIFFSVLSFVNRSQLELCINNILCM